MTLFVSMSMLGTDADGDAPGMPAHIVLLGDSNTWIGGDDCSSPRGWNYWFAREFDSSDVVSYARSGATWSHTSSTTRNPAHYSEIITDDNVIYNQIIRLIEAVDSRSQQSPDLIMIAAGTNDAWFPQFRPEEFSLSASEALGRDIGELLSLPPGKVLSLPEAVRYDLLILSARFPDARLIVMTPMQSVKISDKMLADVSTMIDEVATRSGASVIRQDLLCPVNSAAEVVTRRLTTDGTHTSEEGARKNAAVIIKCVKQILDTQSASLSGDDRQNIF